MLLLSPKAGQSASRTRNTSPQLLDGRCLVEEIKRLVDQRICIQNDWVIFMLDYVAKWRASFFLFANVFIKDCGKGHGC